MRISERDMKRLRNLGLACFCGIWTIIFMLAFIHTRGISHEFLLGMAADMMMSVFLPVLIAVFSVLSGLFFFWALFGEPDE